MEFKYHHFRCGRTKNDDIAVFELSVDNALVCVCVFPVNLQMMNSTATRILIAGGVAAILVMGTVTVFGQVKPKPNKPPYTGGCPEGQVACNSGGSFGSCIPIKEYGSQCWNYSAHNTNPTLLNTPVNALPCITVAITPEEKCKNAGGAWESVCNGPLQCIYKNAAARDGSSEDASISGRVQCVGTGCEQEKAAVYACLAEKCGDSNGQYSIARCGDSNLPAYTNIARGCGLGADGTFKGCREVFDPTCRRGS